MRMAKADESVDLDELVLFPFDNYSVPFRSGLQLNLVEGEKYSDNPVLGHGEAGMPDCNEIRKPTIIRIDGKLRMWYIGVGDQDRNGNICYAESSDGIHWEKPELNLRLYNGRKKNNLVDLDQGDNAIATMTILYEPEDPDTEKLFKMVYDTMPGHKFNVAFSSDGFHWRNSSNNPAIVNAFELSGLCRFNGRYCITGQGTAFRKRCLEVHVSYDFVHWSEAIVLAFRRDNVPPRPMISGWHSGEQVHLGASLWNRGNTLLGFYGMWHCPDPVRDDRRYVPVNIGLLVSHDGIHYHEPIPDFKIIPARVEKKITRHVLPEDFTSPPQLGQAQTFVNMDDKTFVWYESWRYSRIRLITWDRDRLGYFNVTRDVTEGQKPIAGVHPHFISAPIELGGKNVGVFLNADFFSEHSHILVEILDCEFRPVSGYTEKDAVPVNQGGQRIPVAWKSGTSLPTGEKNIRIKVGFRGVRFEDSRVFAVYLNSME